MSKESFYPNKGLRNGFEFQKYLSPTVLLGLILLLGTALRFYDLGTESYWIDEMSTVIEAQQSISQMITSNRLDQPPAYYLPFHFWVQLFGISEVSTRSFSALTGIGSIILIYLIGREVFGKPVGLLSAFLMAIAEYQLFHSQAARFYSLFEFMTLFSFLFLILALRSKKRIYFFLYGLASVVMVYVHTYGVFILVAQNLFFFLQVIKNRNVIGSWLICQALIALSLLPYLFPLLFGAGGIKGAVDFNIGGQSIPTFLDPLGTLYRFIMTTRRERSWEIILVNYAVAGALLIVGTWIYTIWKGTSNLVASVRETVASIQEVPDGTSKFLLVICWLLCPIMLPFISSMILAPMYADHYMISAAPAFYLLLAFGIFSVRRVVPLIISLSVFAITIGPGLVHYYSANIHEEWREVAIYVNENSVVGDVIIFAPNMGIGIQQRTFNWYYQGTLQSCGLATHLPDSEVWKAVTQCVLGHERFWVIIRGTSDDLPYIRYRSFFLNSNQTAMHLVKEQQFVGLSVYLFELTK